MNYFSMRSFNEVMQAVGNVVAPLPEEYSGSDSEEQVEDNYYDNGTPVDSDSKDDRVKQIGNEPEVLLTSDAIPPRSTEEERCTTSYEGDNTPIVVQDEDIAVSNISASHDCAATALCDQEGTNEDLERALATIKQLERDLEHQRNKTTAAFAEVSSLSDDLRACLRASAEAADRLKQEEERGRHWQDKCTELQEQLQALRIAPLPVPVDESVGNGKAGTTSGGERGGGCVCVEESLRALLLEINQSQEVSPPVMIPHSPLSESAKEWASLVDMLTSQWVRRAREMEVLHEQLSAREGQVLDLERHHSEYKLTTARHEQELEEKSIALTALQQEMTELRQLVTREEETLARRKEYNDSLLSGMQEQLAQKETLLTSVQLEVSDLKASLCACEEQRQQRDEELSVLRARLTESQGALTEMVSQLQQRDVTLAVLREQLSDRARSEDESVGIPREENVKEALAQRSGTGDGTGDTQLMTLTAALEAEREQVAACEAAASLLRADWQAVCSERDSLLIQVGQAEESLQAARRRHTELETAMALAVESSSSATAGDMERDRLISTQKQTIAK